MPGLWNENWLSQNSQRRFPLVDQAAATDQTGSFKLPDDFLVELQLQITAGIVALPVRFFVGRLTVAAGGYSLTIQYQPASGNPVDVAVVTISRAGFTGNQEFDLIGRGVFADSRGTVVIGSLTGIDEQPPGLWTFDLASTRLDPMCVSPIPQSVASLLTINNGQVSSPLTGDVVLTAGAGVGLTVTLNPGQDPQVRIDFLGTSADMVDSCECAPAKTPITSINGIPPNQAGEIFIAGVRCVSATTIDNGVLIDNPCAEPCCGPDELVAITRDLEELKQRAVNSEAVVDRLAVSVSTMDQVVLGSRLGDVTCVSC